MERDEQPFPLSSPLVDKFEIDRSVRNPQSCVPYPPFFQTLIEHNIMTPIHEQLAAMETGA